MTKKKVNPSPDNIESIPTLSEESSELGSIRINHSVVAGIVRLATQSVSGVINVGGGGVVEGLTDFFAKRNLNVVFRFRKAKMVDMKLKSEWF